MHKACHFEIKVRNRTNTASIVGAAAYCTGGRYRADRTGQRHDYRRRDVVSVESIRMPHDPERISNLADAAEKHPRGRTAREFVVSLPAALPLDVQRRLVRGYCLWLHDTFGMRSMAAIHPPYVDGMDKEIAADLRPATEGRKRPARYRGGERGNPLNQHVHILCPTRARDPETETFGKKLRDLDDVRTGPEFVQRSREEWQSRVNRALAKAGIADRVDLRSHERQAAAGDAPEGLVAQRRAGPRNTARSRRRIADGGTDDTVSGRSRAEIREANETLRTSWLALRAAEREKARGGGLRRSGRRKGSTPPCRGGRGRGRHKDSDDRRRACVGDRRRAPPRLPRSLGPG